MTGKRCFSEFLRRPSARTMMPFPSGTVFFYLDVSRDRPLAADRVPGTADGEIR
jgi:hypothetical protein